MTEETLFTLFLAVFAGGTVFGLIIAGRSHRTGYAEGYNIGFRKGKAGRTNSFNVNQNHR